MLADKRQCEFFVAMKIGIANQANRDDFAVGESRHRSAGTQSLIQKIERIVDQDKPNGENVNPGTFRDIIGQAAHGTPPEEVGCFTHQCTVPATFVKTVN